MSKGSAMFGAVLLAAAAALVILYHQERVGSDSTGAGEQLRLSESSRSAAPKTPESAGANSRRLSAASAASTQFERHRLCLIAWQGERFFKENPDQQTLYLDRDAAFKGLTAVQRVEREKLLDGYEEMVNAMERAKSECSDMAGRLEDGSIYADALAAAELGDQRAANCYVSVAFPMPESMRLSEQAAAEYKNNAAQLIEHGIEQGNWTMVLLAIEAENGENRTWIRNLATFDPAVLLRLLNLQALGAPDAATRDQFRELADMQKEFTPADKVATAERWAKSTYRASFSKTPHVNREIPFCH